MSGSSIEQVNWTWGVSLIVLTVAIHALGVVMMAFAGLQLRSCLGSRNFPLWFIIAELIGVIAVIGMLLVLLHGIEATIWAVAYLWLGALRDCQELTA